MDEESKHKLIGAVIKKVDGNKITARTILGEEIEIMSEKEQREINIVGWWGVWDEQEKLIGIFPTRQEANTYGLEHVDFYEGWILEISEKK